jgi:pimeloyl-ACP methyl ester carboxylesterase
MKTKNHDKLKKSAKIAVIIIAVIAALLLISSITHSIFLKSESDAIIPIGKMVEVDGAKMRVYVSESESVNATTTLVFMSGAGTAAPIYDFKPLYSLLADEYKIIVVEKFGYGYSDTTDLPRNIENMCRQTRKAIELSGENLENFVLLPHSMSGLEALYWAQNYPKEIKAIIGLDMAVPAAYLPETEGYIKVPAIYTLLNACTKLGVQRIGVIYPISQNALITDEFTQAKLLTYRNAVNRTMLNEANVVMGNAITITANPLPKLPVLLFKSDGKEIGDFWNSVQQNFADYEDGELISLDCGHYIHQYMPEQIAAKCKGFLRELGN